MHRATCLLAVLALAALTACATPEIAEDYEAKIFVPEELQAALGSGDPAERADAANQVEAMEHGARRTVLLSLCHDERAAVRLMAVRLIEKHHAGDAEAVSRLAEVLTLDADVDVRVTAIGALASSGRLQGLRAILDALTDDPAFGVRRAAASALDRITGKAFGVEVVERIDETEMSAEDAMMSYDDWFETNRDALRWDAGRCRFVIGR